MKSNFERLTSLFLVASAIALVAKTSPAHARHYLQERSLAVAGAATPWLAVATKRRDRASRYSSRGRWAALQRRRYGHHGQAYWRDNFAVREDIRFVDGTRRDSWDHNRVSWSENAPIVRRRSRVASLAWDSVGGSLQGSDIVAEARRWVGTNPTGWAHLWCGRFMNFVLERTGHRGTGSNLARSFAQYGSRIGGPQVGAIAVMARRGRAAGGSPGGHVGVVSGFDPNGNPIIISGNHGHRVAEAVYPRSRIFAYVKP
jgi:uncharacterized protein (TIGR02594 family)